MRRTPCHRGSRVQLVSDSIELRPGVEVSGRFASLIVELRVGSRRNVSDAAFWARKLGLRLELVQQIDSPADGQLEAYTAWGAPDAVERFCSFAFVHSYYLSLSTRVSWQGQGAGEDKPQHHRPLPHVREALQREDKRADAACAARLVGCDDNVRRERLFS